MITEYWNKLVMPSIFVTLEIVFFTVLIGFVLGFIMAILLTLYWTALQKKTLCCSQLYH